MENGISQIPIHVESTRSGSLQEFYNKLFADHRISLVAWTFDLKYPCQRKSQVGLNSKILSVHLEI